MKRKPVENINFTACIVVLFIENLVLAPLPPARKRLSVPMTPLGNEEFRAEMKNAVL